MKKIILIVAMVSASFGLFAQHNKEEQNKTEISIEIDPTNLGFHGYGVHLRVKPKNNKHLLFGVGAYALNYPNILVNLNNKNKDKGWNIRLNQGYGLYGEYFFHEVNKKWFVGGQLAIQEHKIENKNIIGSKKFINSLFMASTGYSWQPFDFGFYIKPWAGIGYSTKLSGTNTLGNLEYDIAPLSMIVVLHLGYTF